MVFSPSLLKRECLVVEVKQKEGERNISDLDVEDGCMIPFLLHSFFRGGGGRTWAGFLFRYFSLFYRQDSFLYFPSSNFLPLVWSGPFFLPNPTFFLFW
jgi:hypothetical protein